jgi:NAD(P)H-hydrate epimerase
VDGAVKREPFESAELRCRAAARRRTRATSAVLIVAGGYGMHGAPVLSASAAFRSGAGLVTVALPLDLRSPDRPSCARRGSRCESGAGALGRRRFRRCSPRSRAPTSSRSAPGWARRRGPSRCCGFVPRIDKPLVLDADGLKQLP